MKRTIEQWAGCNPHAMAFLQSRQAIWHAFSDAKAEILTLSEERKELLLALIGMVEVFGDEFGIGDSETVDRARAAIAKAAGGAA